jgi:hypothetical protein
MPPRLTSAQLAALQPGDRVSRIALPGVWETAPVARVTSKQIGVMWSDGRTVWYWRESGQRVGCHGEQLREPEPDPRMSPERWREVLYVHLRDEMQRHQFTKAEEIALGAALTDENSSASGVLIRCARSSFEPMDSAALIVGTVVERRLSEADARHAELVKYGEYPDSFVVTVPEWAQDVAGG